MRKHYSSSIRERKHVDGTSVFQVTIEAGTDPNGKRVRHHGTAPSKRKAKELEYQMIEELNQENDPTKPIAVSSMALKEWMEIWLNTFGTELSATTKARYRDIISHYINPKLGMILLHKLTMLDIQDFLNEIKNCSPCSGHPLRAKTIRNIYHVLNSACKKAVRNGNLSRNPCEGIQLPKKEPYEAAIYDHSSIQRCLQYAKDTDLYLPLLLCFSMGLRRGELIALRWEDIDFEKGILHIHRNRVIAGGTIIEKAPKTRSGDRYLPINDGLLALLQAAQNKSHGEYVVCKENGSPYAPDSYTRKFHRFLQKNNLPHIKFHSTRHSSASLMVASGIDIATVQKILGHASPTTTLNVYTHTTAAAGKAAAKKMGELLITDKLS